MSVTVSKEHLESLKIVFQDAIKVIDGLLHTEVTETSVKKSPKKRNTVTRTRTTNNKNKDPIGKCGYCSAKTMKKLNTRVEYDAEPTRCGKTAYHIKDGVMLCDRHKENDIGKIVKIINEPVVSAVTDMEEDVEIDEIFNVIKPIEDVDIEEVMKRVTGTERMLGELDPQPCICGSQPMLYVNYNNSKYVVSTYGVCYGKVSESDLKAVDALIKRKGLLDVSGKLYPLKRSDTGFIMTYELSYIKDHIN